MLGSTLATLTDCDKDKAEHIENAKASAVEAKEAVVEKAAEVKEATATKTTEAKKTLCKMKDAAAQNFYRNERSGS